MTATIEAGLPGTGPLPVHLHTGKPTPWSEGCVVSFTPKIGAPWVGNLQAGYGYVTKIVEWCEANALIIIAQGAVYFVRPDVPSSWTFIDLLGIDCIISPRCDVAILSTYNDVVSVAPDGTERWRRSVAIDGVEITDITPSLIHGNAGIDPPDEWHPFVLRIDTGVDA